MILSGTNSKGEQWEATIDSEVNRVESRTFTDPVGTSEDTYVIHRINIAKPLGEVQFASLPNDDPAVVLQSIFELIQKKVG